MINGILAYLKANKWEFEQLESDVVATGFSTNVDSNNSDDRHEFVLFIMQILDAFGDRFIRFTIVPYLEQSIIGYPYDLYIRTMQINHDLPGLKFAFDGDGDLELIYDLPEAQFSDGQMEKILQLLADFSGVYFKELSVLVEQALETIPENLDDKPSTPDLG